MAVSLRVGDYVLVEKHKKILNRTPRRVTDLGVARFAEVAAAVRLHLALRQISSRTFNSKLSI